MRELITDEMVETAARAYHEAAPEAVAGSWDVSTPLIHERGRGRARAALEAAAPLIAAATLRDAADREMTAWEPVLMSPDWVEAIESVCETLRARANELEANNG